MKTTMVKLFTTLTVMTTSIFAGGDIEPVEPVMDPVVTSSGDALTMIGMILMVSLTTAVGLYFVKKQNTHAL